MSLTLSVDNVATLISREIESSIKSAIAEKLHADIDPMIEEIAIKSAKECCELAIIAIGKDLSDPFSATNIRVTFNKKGA